MNRSTSIAGPHKPASKIRCCLRFLGCFIYDAFLRGFTRQLFLMALLVLIFLVLGGFFAAGYGGPPLFWNEQPQPQFYAGFAVGLLLCKIFFVGFLLDLNRKRLWLHSYVANRLGTIDDPFEAAIVYMKGSFVVVILLALLVLVLRWIYPDPPDGPFSGYRLSQFLPLPLGALTAAIFVLALLWVLAKWSSSKDPIPSWLKDKLSWLLPNIGQDTEARLHVVAAIMFLGLLLLYFVAPGTIPNLTTPVTAICTLLGLIAAGFGFVKFRLPNSSLLIALLLFVCGIEGMPNFKVPIPIFEKFGLYDHPVAISHKPSAKPANLVITEQTLSKTPKRMPLALVCTSGGGIRAMVWTGAMLGQIEKNIDGFPYQVKLICGASGGMVGASFYVQTLQDPNDAGAAPAEANFHHAVSADQMSHLLAEDDLSEIVRQGVYSDVPATFLFRVQGRDRGQALETAWDQHLGPGFASATLGSLAEGERQGWRPSLVFSPMLVEDGRRLLISNLDLDFMTSSDGPLLGGVGPGVSGTVPDVQPPDASDATYSEPAIELSRFFPTVWKQFPLSTAARLNASFPYFAPAAELPTTPRRRVVDAGYYDNYGLSVATAWLDHLLSTEPGREWVREHVSGVVLIQLRDGVNELSGNQIVSTDTSGPLGRGLEWLTSPPSALLAARDSVSLFRNDAQVQRLISRWQSMERILRPQADRDKPYTPDPQYFTTVVFENPGHESLSWYLSSKETEGLISAAKAHRNLQGLKAWWTRHGASPPPSHE